jgi:uncharacterized protein
VTAYVDTSALLKRYVEEADSDHAEVLLASAGPLVTARHTLVEVRRSLALRLDPAAASDARAAFAADVPALNVIELDAATCDLAASVAEQQGVRTLDALHLGAALRLGTGAMFITFDVRQAQAARSLGFAVAGA